MTLALEMWDWCQTIRDIFVIASSHPRKRQRLCGQGVQRIEGHERVEVGPNNYSAFSAELSDGFVSKSSNPDPGDAFTINWAPLWGFASPPPPPLQFDIDVQNPDESNNRPNGTNSRCSSLASPALLAGSSETSNISAIVATDQSNPLNGPNQPEPSSSNVPSPSLGRVSHLYRRLQAEGIPTNIADLLIAATRISTHKTYESSWNRWCRWRSGQD